MSEHEINQYTIRKTLRQQSVSFPDEKPSHLIADAITDDNNLTYNDVGNLRRMIWRKRARRFRKLPKTKLQTLSELAEMASDGDQNVRRVKGNIVLLARENDIKQLLAKPNVTLFCDGTFK